MLKFIKDGMSLDEFKVSALVICLLLITGTAIVAYFKYGDITSNLLALLQTLIISVGGVNAISALSDFVSISKSKQDDEMDGR